MIDRVWAPWRQRYLRRRQPKGCLFCRIVRSRQDRRHFVVHRGRSAFVVLNLYPYTNGHLMVVPNRHTAQLNALTPPERLELWQLAEQFMQRLGRVIAPHGYNLGINLGPVSGAGILGHLHLHVVPRWRGDVNFMTTIGQTRVISDSLAALYDRLTRASDG